MASSDARYGKISDIFIIHMNLQFEATLLGVL